MSTLKTNTLDTPNGSGNITFSRPTVLTAGDIVEADIADNAITLAKMAGGTDGQIITYDASGDPVAIGPGTDGQVLTSTGAGSPPAFEAVAGATYMWKFLSTQTASGDATVDFFSLATSTYKKFRIEFHDVYPSADAIIQMRIREAGGPAVLTGAIYNGFIVGGRAGTSANTVLSSSVVDAITLQMTEDTINGTSVTRHHGFVEFSGFGPDSPAQRPTFYGMFSGAYADTTSMGQSFYYQLNSEDTDGYDGVQFLLSTGTYTGTFSLYGLNEA